MLSSPRGNDCRMKQMEQEDGFDDRRFMLVSRARYTVMEMP